MKLIAAAFIAMMATAPAATQPDPAAQFQAIWSDLQANQCRTVPSRMAALLKSPDLPQPLRWFAGFGQILCLYKIERPQQAREAAQALATILPPEQAMAAWFLAAADGGQFTDAETALRRAISIDPAYVRGLDPDIVTPALAQAREAKRTDIRDSLVLMLGDIGFGGDEIQIRDNFMGSAARQHLLAGRIHDAERLARQIVSRGAMISLLVDRRTEALWPLLEESAGTGMARSNRAALEAARNHAATLGPAETSAAAADARRNLMLALWDVGERQAALDEGGRALDSPETLAAATERQAWLLNEHAMLLAEAGDIEAADKRLESLTELDIKSRPWLINMRINRAITLLEHGRPLAVSPLIDGLKADAEAYGSPYARQLVRWLTICASAQSGNREAAEAGKADLITHADDALLATANALICLDDQAGAAAQLVALLEDEDRRLSAIDALQPEWVSRDARDGKLRPLLARPEVAAAYLRVARDLPDSLRPAN